MDVGTAGRVNKKAGGGTKATKSRSTKTNKAGSKKKRATDEDVALTKKATKILTKKFGREPTQAEVAKKAKALAKKAAKNKDEEEGMGFNV